MTMRQRAERFWRERGGMMYGPDALIAFAESEVRALRRIIGAYLLDRADQFDPSAGYATHAADTAVDVMAGEAEASAAHGELDDVFPRVDRIVQREARIKAKEASRDEG